jgi:L-rhamnose isomerase / sugar isomerase
MSALSEAIARDNAARRVALDEDYGHLGHQLARRGLDIEALVARAAAFRVAIPSWGVGTGGTRFARFPGAGEPRTLLEKLDDCGVVQALVRITPGISLHIPWDKPREQGPGDAASIRARLLELGLSIDSMNSNTFQDQPGQPLSYKFGSLSHTEAAVRRQAVEHNLECLAIGQALGATSHTVWIGDGGNFPGQIHFRRALDRYVESLQAIYAQLPTGWRMFIEHKFYEPAFYSTVLNDWGTSYLCARQVGDRCLSLVDLGHHAPNVNIEQIVARLVQLGGLGGFHFNDSKFGDDDLDAGSIKPFQLFLIFNELVDAELERVPGFAPAYMLDQSHNVTDPLESLMTSGVEVVRACVQAHLVDRTALAEAQDGNDATRALQVLKQAFTTDVSPILAMARLRDGGAIDPVAAYRASGYRAQVARQRPASGTGGSGIV